MSSNFILIKITDNRDDLVKYGKKLTQSVIGKCNIQEYEALIKISNPDPVYYALVESNDCVWDMADKGEITVVTDDEFGKIQAENPSAITAVELKTDEKSNCMIS